MQIENDGRFFVVGSVRVVIVWSIDTASGGWGGVSVPDAFNNAVLQHLHFNMSDFGSWVDLACNIFRIIEYQGAQRYGSRQRHQRRYGECRDCIQSLGNSMHCW